MTEIICISSLEKLFIEKRPRLIERGRTIAKNATCSFQIAIFCDDIKNFSIKVRGADENLVSVYRERYIPCYKTKFGYEDDYVIFKERAEGFFPDLLEDGRGVFEINANEWTPFWITVKGDLPVGENKLTVEVYDRQTEAVEASAEYTITVADVTLPELNLYYTTWFHYDCLARTSGTRPFSPSFYEVLGKNFDNMTAHGMNTILTPIFTPPLDTEIGGERKTVQLVDVYEENGKYTFGFDRLLYFMNFASAHGMKYFEMSHLATQWGAEFCPKIVAEANGKKRVGFGWKVKSTSEKYKSFLAAFLPELTEFLEKNGYRGKCFFHISDEPSEDHINTYSELRRTIKPLIGDFKTIDALSCYDYYAENLVDLPVVSTDADAPFKENAVERWSYYCCAQEADGLSNRFFNMTGERTAVIGVQLYLAGTRGFLHWGYNFYNSALSKKAINPYESGDNEESFPAGDAFIVYPTKKGVLNSIRGEILAEAFEDYRLLTLAEQKEGREKIVKFLNDRGYFGFTDYPHSPEKLAELRTSLYDLVKN